MAHRIAILPSRVFSFRRIMFFKEKLSALKYLDKESVFDNQTAYRSVHPVFYWKKGEEKTSSQVSVNLQSFF